MMNNTLAERSTHLYAQYKLVLFACFGLLLLFAGGFLYSSYYYKKTWARTIGTVTQADCQTYTQHTQNRSVTKYSCYLQVAHKLNKKARASIMTDSMRPYQKGDKLDVTVDPVNPNNIVLTDSIPTWGMAMLAILCGLLIIAVAGKSIVYCSKNKCSALGAVFAFNELTDAIRGRR